MLIILYRKNEQGKLRYYSLDDRQQTLFNPFALTVRWGASPDGGSSRTYTFDKLAARDQKIRRILKAKLRDWEVLYSYFRDQSPESGLTGFSTQQSSGTSKRIRRA